MSLLAGVLLGVLTACANLPRAVEGVPAGPPWFTLPLSQWLAEGRAEPEAMAACDECGPGIAVGVLRLSGQDALEAEAVLRAPERLASALESSQDNTRKIRTHASVRRLQVGTHSGFLLTLKSSIADKPPVYGEALGQRDAEGLRVILVIGGDARAVEETAERVVVEQLGS